MSDQTNAYWKANLRVMGVLMLIWFIVSFGAGILWIDQLDKFKLGGFKLGFWFTQQGAMVCFVLIIFAYSWYMKKVDKKFNVDE